jgi:transposase
MCVANTFTQYNVTAPEKKLSYHANRVGIAERFSDESVQRAVRSGLAFAEHLDEQLRGIELYLTQHAKIDDPQAFGRLQTVPGIGPILAMVILYEVHDIARFGSVPQFVSYSRLVKCSHESAGKSLNQRDFSLWPVSTAEVAAKAEAPERRERPLARWSFQTAALIARSLRPNPQ